VRTSVQTQLGDANLICDVKDTRPGTFQEELLYEVVHAATDLVRKGNLVYKYGGILAVFGPSRCIMLHLSNINAGQIQVKLCPVGTSASIVQEQ